MTDHREGPQQVRLEAEDPTVEAEPGVIGDERVGCILNILIKANMAGHVVIQGIESLNPREVIRNYHPG